MVRARILSAGVVSVGLLTVGGVSSFAGVEIFGFVSMGSGSAVVSAGISVLSETETVVCSCGTLLCAGSFVTIS